MESRQPDNRGKDTPSTCEMYDMNFTEITDWSNWNVSLRTNKTTGKALVDRYPNHDTSKVLIIRKITLQTLPIYFHLKYHLKVILVIIRYFVYIYLNTTFNRN